MAKIVRQRPCRWLRLVATALPTIHSFSVQTIINPSSSSPSRNPHPSFGPKNLISSSFASASSRTKTSPPHGRSSANLSIFASSPKNPFSFLFSDEARSTPPPAPLSPARLRQIAIDEGEIRRAAQVRTDGPAYASLFLLQLLPLAGTDRRIALAYFLGTAVLTVYLGGRQATIDPPERITKTNALTAPIGASVAIGGLYVLLKNGVDPTALYAFAVTTFGALAISDVGVPLLRNLAPGVFDGDNKVRLPDALSGLVEDEDEGMVGVDGLTALGIGVACALIYWTPVAMTQKFVISNIIAWFIAMASMGTISLGSIQTGALLLAGLFCYDVFWVFGTDVMMTVATTIEAPVKFLCLAPFNPDRGYPFSVLGLGDIVIPGLFVSLTRSVDEALEPTKAKYFDTATIAYAVGLSTCFVVNEITHAGQPALLYLVPACVGSVLAAGAVNGQLDQVWNFQEATATEEEQ